MSRKLTHVAGCAGLALALAGGAGAEDSVRQAFDLAVMQPPAAVATPGGPELLYELHMTNFAGHPLTLAAVDALDAATGKHLGGYRGEALVDAIGRPGLAAGDGNRLSVAPGMRAIAYLSVPVGADVRGLRHRVEFAAQEVPGRWTVEGAAVPVDERPLPELGPPLRGGPWAAVFHPSWERGHRRVFYAVDGQASIPGRFAIDWMRAHDATAPEQSDGHGADVLAVADGRVVALRDNFRQPEEHDAIPLGEGNGNHVTLDLGGGRYAFYEHLARGVRVEIGDRVKKGDVIAALGATGHVTRPHLHFHVGDTSSPLGAEGLPYALTNFRALGAYDSIDAFRSGKAWRALPAGEPAAGFSFPSPMMVVEFTEPDE